MKAGAHKFGLVASKVRSEAGQDVESLTESAACLVASALAILVANGDELSQEAWGAVYLLEAATGMLTTPRGRGRP